MRDFPNFLFSRKPGAFKLEHLQHFKPILFSKFSILGVNSFYPREGKGEIGNMETSKPDWWRGNSDFNQI